MKLACINSHDCITIYIVIIYFLLTTCGGLSGGDSSEISCLSDLLGTPFRLVESFFSGRGEILVDSTF